MTDKQPEALRLAELYEGFDVAEELRRLHEENKELRARLAQPEPEELGEIVPADEEQLKRIAKLVEPEPVAWMDSDGFPWTKQGVECRTTPDTYTPLYTAPPQREWQGLTLKDLMGILNRDADETDLDTARAIEQALKEKNT